jgi:3-hydroxyisobutyrate dehydrogenase-like beta-hydroxyacid dehydrogenase
MKKVGFIGLGIMGSGMAARLLEHGYELTVWNRDPAKARPLVEKGAKLAASPADLAAQVEVVITMVKDDAVVRKILLGEKGAIQAAKPGTTFIDMSTVTPMMGRELAAVCQEKGFPFLDAPVAGSKGAAASGQLGILVGGEAATLESVRDILQAMSQSITHVGPNGSSAILKLANNQLTAVLMAALGESLALCNAAGLDRELCIETLVGTVSRVSGMKKPKILNKDFSTEFALDMIHKDMTQTLQAASELTLPMPLLATAREIYQHARKDGKGGQDFSIITQRD